MGFGNSSIKKVDKMLLLLIESDSIIKKSIQNVIEKEQELLIDYQNLKNLYKSDNVDNITDLEKLLEERKLSSEPKTLEDLSKKYKISRERVRQIENKAFEKLQKHMLLLAKSKNLLPVN